MSTTAKSKGFGKWMVGRKQSQETILKRVLKLKGRKYPNKNKKGIPRSIETRRKISEAQRGEKHHNWKGGITKERSRIYSSFEYKI